MKLKSKGKVSPFIINLKKEVLPKKKTYAKQFSIAIKIKRTQIFNNNDETIESLSVCPFP